MVAKIKAEGLKRSQVGRLFDTLTTEIGPRLTGSPAFKRSAEWTRDTLASWGLDRPRLEPWQTAIVLASFLYHAAMREGLLPRTKE